MFDTPTPLGPRAGDDHYRPRAIDHRWRAAVTMNAAGKLIYRERASLLGDPPLTDMLYELTGLLLRLTWGVGSAEQIIGHVDTLAELLEELAKEYPEVNSCLPESAG